MHIHSLRLEGFRSHVGSSYTFGKKISVISGPNGSGKTSILEAVHVLLRGKSFRDADGAVLRDGEAWWRVDGVIDDAARDVRYVTSGTRPHKEVVIEGVKRGRFTAKYALPVVVFEPDDLQLLHGSPSRRRRHIDPLVTQLHPGYASVLRSYERALLQRNSLLKKGGFMDDTLFVWDMTLAGLAAQIIARRQEVITLMSPLLSSGYSDIARTGDAIQVEYQAASEYGSVGQLQQRIVALLAARRERDRLMGFTSIGPHRDDVRYTLQGRDMATTASRGETRSLLLAIKLAETTLIERTLQESPIILLDDVFSELDASRRDALVHNLAHDEQIIITTTNSDVRAVVPGAFEHIALD